MSPSTTEPIGGVFRLMAGSPPPREERRMATIAQEARDFGIKPVPLEHRALGTWDTFVLWADLGISFLVMVVGTFLVPGLGLGQALLAILVGAVIGNALLGVGAAIGSDTR